MPELFDINYKKAKRGKNIDSLRESREALALIKNKFGKTPTSILFSKLSHRYPKIDLEADKRSCGQHHRQRRKEAYEQSKDASLSEIFYTSSMGARGSKILSVFPQDVAETIIEIYCPENGRVFDPFMGHNSRMEVTFKCGRSYVGVDVCHEFMESNRKIRELLFKNAPMIRGKKLPEITLIEKSSSSVPEIKSKSADFTITSPPYYNIEYYGPEEEQLGNEKTYDKFLDKIFLHVLENKRILKDDAFCCWFINDFRYKGEFFPFHIDLFQLFIKAGFKPFNIYIVDLGDPIGRAWPAQMLRTKILPKRHEYILVFKA